MGTSCITTVTAFVVVNARRFGMRTFDLALWAGPIAVLAVGLTISEAIGGARVMCAWPGGGRDVTVALGVRRLAPHAPSASAILV
jgi:hypothetical protein